MRKNRRGPFLVLMKGLEHGERKRFGLRFSGTGRPFAQIVPMFYLLILAAAASRFLPHPPNVACVAALGLFAGYHLSSWRAFVVPPAVMFLGDLVGQLAGLGGLGFYHPVTMLCVYTGMIAAVPLGRWISRSENKWRIPAASLVASTCFFVISNLGIWLGGFYSFTLAGLIACYINAIPFFGYTIAGDLLYTGVIFGAWELSRRTEGRFLAGRSEVACGVASSGK